MERPAFLDQLPPIGYVAGIGRGATGFSIRGKNKNPIPSRFFNNNKSSNTEKDNDIEDNESKEEARIMAMIDDKRNRKNSNSDNTEKEKFSKNDEFSNLKRSLKNVSEDQWLNLPEASDFTRRNKRNRLQEQLTRKTYAAPDTLLSKTINLSELTEEREKVLGRQLDINFLSKENNGQQTNISEKYLKELEVVNGNATSEEQSEDIKKMRTILQSYIKSNPKEPQGWIAFCKLEEKARHFQMARKIIDEGCKECPRSDDLWLENIRLNESNVPYCKNLVATAIKYISTSKKLWLQAIELENDIFIKQKIVRKALQRIPTEEQLWQLAINFEKDKKEKIRVLNKAVEFAPESVNLWKSMISLQNFQDAKKSLQVAQKHLPYNLELYIIDAQIDEKNGSFVIEDFTKLLVQFFDSSIEQERKISNFEWLNQIYNLESSIDSKIILKSLISVIISKSLQFNNNVNDIFRFVDNLKDCYTKIFSLREMLLKHPVRFTFWKSLKKACFSLSEFDELYGTYDTILFKDDHTMIHEMPSLALLYAKDIWRHKLNIEAAIEILNKAITIVPNTLDFWFAKLKILSQNERFNDVEILFKEMFKHFELNNSSISEKNSTTLERLYYKHISFLRYKMHYDEAIKLLKIEYIPKYPKCYKFYLQMGQIYESLGKYEKSIEVYLKGTNEFPQVPYFWISISSLKEKKLNNISQARSHLELAIVNNEKNESLYCALSEFEVRQNNLPQAKLVVTQGLKQLPHSALLWSQNIKLLEGQKSSTKKTIFQDALKNTKNNYLVLLRISTSFYQDANYNVALKWLERTTKSELRYGDSWVWLARTYQKLNKDLTSIFQDVEEYEPYRGDEWISVSKNPSTQYYTASKILSSLL